MEVAGDAWLTLALTRLHDIVEWRNGIELRTVCSRICAEPVRLSGRVINT